MCVCVRSNGLILGEINLIALASKQAANLCLLVMVACALDTLLLLLLLLGVRAKKVCQLHFLSRPLDETVISSSSSSHRLSLARKRINAKSRRERKRALKVADLSRLNEP